VRVRGHMPVRFFGAGPRADYRSSPLPIFQTTLDWMKQFSDDSLKIVYVQCTKCPPGADDLGECQSGQGWQTSGARTLAR